MEVMFVGEAAAEVGRRLGREVTPRELSALLYDRRVVPAQLAPVVGGRRVIRPAAVDAIVAALRERDAGRHQRGKGDGSDVS